MQDITVWKVPVYQLLMTLSQGPHAQQVPIVYKVLTNQSHVQ